MITSSISYGQMAGQTFAELRGLSTDSKPTLGIPNGAAFLEMDTGKLYFFNEAGTAWVEWGGN